MKLKTYQKRPSGFTLIELLIYIGILTIVMLVMTDILVAILNVKTESEATISADQDGHFILSRLGFDVSRATSITTPASFGAPGAATLTMVIGGANYTYSLNSNNLQLTNNAQVDNLNSSETTISNLNFQKIGNPSGKDTIKITFTVNSKTQRPSGPEVRTYETTLGRR